MCKCIAATQRHLATLARSCALLAGATLLTGCLDNTTTRIDGSRDTLFQPALHAAIDLDATPGPAAAVHSGLALELGYQKNSFTTSQLIPAGAYPVVFADSYFNGPALLTNEFNFSYRRAGLRTRLFPDDKPLGLEASAGIAAATLGITLSSQTQRASRELSEEGFDLGLGLIWRLNDRSSLHANYATLYALGIELQHYGAGYQVLLMDHLALRAGYSHWDIWGSTGGSASDFNINYSGPSLDVELAF